MSHAAQKVIVQFSWRGAPQQIVGRPLTPLSDEEVLVARWDALVRTIAALTAELPTWPALPEERRRDDETATDAAGRAPQ